MLWLEVARTVLAIATLIGVGTSAFCPLLTPDGFMVSTRLQARRSSLAFSVLFSSREGEGLNDDTFDMDELTQRIAQQANTPKELPLFSEESATENPEEVHIILFNPDSEQEGVHTVEFPKGSGNNVILAFESRSDCERFAGILKAQHFFDPSPQETNFDQLVSYCASIGVFVQVVPEGLEIVPPTDTVDNLGLNPNLRQEQAMLDQLFAVDETKSENSAIFSEEDTINSWE